jgi:hypothetical protein
MYARVVWTVDDVRTLAPKLTEAEAEVWLDDNESDIQSRLVELGWDVISTLLAADGIDTSDMDDGDDDEDEDQ